MPTLESDEELAQIGILERWRTIDRFDANFDVRLRTYAEPSVKGAIARAARTQLPVELTVREANDMVEVAATRERLLREWGRLMPNIEFGGSTGGSAGPVYGTGTSVFTIVHSLSESSGTPRQSDSSFV